MGLLLDAETRLEKLLIRGKELTHIDPKVVEIAGSRKPTLVPDAALQSFLHSPSILKSFKHLSTSIVRIQFSAQPARLVPAKLYLFQKYFFYPSILHTPAGIQP